MKFLETYNLVDLFILGILLVTIVFGLWKGFVRSLTALASVVVGVVLAATYYPAVQPYLGRVTSLDQHISAILSMVIVFIAVQVVFVLIRRILEALIDLTQLSWLDRVLGACMGLAAGAILVAAAVQVMVIGVPEWSMVKTSKLVRPVERLSTQAVNAAPDRVRQPVEALVARLKGPQEPPTQQAPRRNAPGAGPTAAPGATK
jgi:membrane protein required for colicin V production